MGEPICEFQSNDEMQKCLKEWQERLFLNDWIIKVIKVSRADMPLDLAGRNEYQVENKCSVISLIEADEDVKSRIVKYCEEKILVHELLHCKYNLIEDCNGSYEGKHLEITEHMLLEQMAKSLIMAKYNVGFEWFKNF